MTKTVYINRVSAFLPLDPVKNDEMEQRLGQVGSRPSRARKLILRSNGIKQRHYVIDPSTGKSRYSNAQLTAEAIRGLTDDNFQLEDIECLTAGTSLPDQLAPNHAVMVHGELGNPPCEVVATSGICLCGITALKYAWMSIATGQSTTAVAAGSEAVSNFMSAANFNEEYEHRISELEQRPEIAFEKDFLRWMLSDGAGAVLLQDHPRKEGVSLRIDWIDTLSFADRMPACMYAGGEQQEDGSLIGWNQFTPEARSQKSIMALKQNVKLLNENIVQLTVVETLQRIMQKRNLQAEQIDYFLPHYSSEYFRDRLKDGLDKAGLPIPQSRWFTNLVQKGNTGSASIFIMLEELFESGKLQAGQKILCYIPESGRFSSAFMHLTVTQHAS